MMDEYYRRNMQVIREEMEARLKHTPPGTLWGMPVIECEAVPDGEIRFVQIRDGDIEVVGVITGIGEVKDGE